MAKTEKKLLRLKWMDAQPFDWAVGRYGSKFLKELRDNKKLVGIKCPKCGFVYMPPRKVCGKCFVAMDELVEVSDKGVIESYTVVYFSFLDPETGKQRPVPYGYGFVKLDGADSCFMHFFEETDLKKLKIGLRAQAVFEENRTGSIADIKHFRIIEE
jgi:hypothetical protein